MANINSVSNSNSYSSATNNLYGTRNVLSGLATGMDTEAMIQNSVSSYQTKIDGLKQDQEKLTWKQDAYRSITDKMIALSEKYTSFSSKTNLASNSFFDKAVTTTASGTYASKVSVTGKTDNDIQINSVTSLASAARYTVSAQKAGLSSAEGATSKTLGELLGEDRFTGEDGAAEFSVNGVAIEGLTKDSTLQQVLTAINSSDAGVKASFSELTGEFSFVTKATGADAQISFGGLGADMFGAPDEADGVDARFTAGTNAVLSATVNGKEVTLERDSNTISMDGLSVTLKGTFETGANDEAITFATATDSDKIVNTLKSFVEDYNAIMKEVHGAFATKPLTKSSGDSYKPLTEADKSSMSDSAVQKYEEKAKTGLLFGDSDLSALYSGLRDIASSIAGELSSAGVTANYADGVTSLEIDEEKLRSTLESNPDKVRDAFTKTKNSGASSDGMMTRVKDMFTKYSSKSVGAPGILVKKAGTKLSSTSLLNNTMQTQINNIDKQIQSWQTKMSSKVDYYTKMFSKLEQLVNTMNNQSSALSGMMGY